MKTSFVLALLLLGAARYSPIALAQSPGTFSLTGGMTMPRAGHTAILLLNGKVLVARGVLETAVAGHFMILATAELYDRSTGTFTANGNMTTPRIAHSATLFLVAGCWSPEASETPVPVPVYLRAPNFTILLPGPSPLRAI